MDHRQWQMNQGSQPNYVQNLQLGQRRSNDGNLSWPINQQVQWPQGAQSRRDVNQQIPQGNLTDIPVQLQQWQLQQYLNNRSVGGQNQSGQFAGGEPMHNQSWQRNTSLQVINDNVVNQVNHGRGIHQVCTSTNYSQASNQQVHQVSVPLQEWHGILSSHTNERSCQLPAAHQRNAFTVNRAQLIRQSGNVENPGTSGGAVNYSASPHFATTQSNTLHHDNFPVRSETEQLFTRRLSDGYQLPNPVSEEPAQFLSDPNISPPQLLHRYELMQQLKNKVLTSVLSDQTKIDLPARPRRKNRQRTNPESNTPQLGVDTSFGNTCVQSPGNAPMPSPGVAPVLSPGSAPMLSPGAGPIPSCNQYSAPPMSRPPSASSSYLSHPGTAPMPRPPSTTSSHHSQNQGQDLHVGSLPAVSHVRRLSRASSQGQQHCLQQPPSEVGWGQSAVSNSSRSSTPQAANDSLTDNQGGGQQASIFTSFLSGIREDIQNLKGLTLEKLRSSKQILKDKMHSLHIHLQDEQEGSGIISHNKITLYNTAVQEMEALMLTLQNEIAEREDEEAMKMLEMILSGDDNKERTSAQVGVETNQMVGTSARRKSQDHAASIHTSSSQHVIQQPTPLPVQPGVPNVQSSVQRSERSMSVQKVGSRIVDRRSSGASRPGDVRPMRPESRESGLSDKRLEVRPQSRQSGCISACSNISSDVQVISAASFPGRQENQKEYDYDREYERELILEAIEHYSLSPLEDVSSSSEIEGDNPPEYVVMDEDDIRCWYEFVMRSTSPDVMEKQQPSLVISNVQSLSHWEEGDTNSTGVERRGSTLDTVVPLPPVGVSVHSLPISEPIMHGTSSNNDRSDVEDSKTCVVGEPIPGEIFRQFRSLSPAHDTIVGGETGQVNSNTTICDPTLSTEPDNAARMEAMLSRINHFQDYLTNVVDITPPSTPDNSRLSSESPPSKSSNTDVNGGVLPGKEAVSLRRLFSQVVDRDYSIDSGTDTQQHGNAAQKAVSDDVNSMMNNSELLKGVVNEDLSDTDKAVQAMTMAVSKEGHNNAASTSGSGQELDSIQTTAEANRLPEYGKMFEAIESDSEDEVSEPVNLEDIPEDYESSEDSLPEITHQSWRKRNDMRRRRRLGSSPSVVLSSAVTMSDKDRKMITSVWNNDRTAAQRNQTLPNDLLSSSTSDKDDTHGKGQMAQDSVHDTSVTEKDNGQCNKTSSKAANETFPEEQSQIGSSKDNHLESAEEKGLNSTADQEANETELPGLSGKTESRQLRNRIISDGFDPQSVVDSVVKLQENLVEKVACVTTECGMEMQETCPLVNSESSEAVISISAFSNDTKSAEPCTSPLITVTDLVTVSPCTKTVEPVKVVSETDTGVVSCESDVDTVGTGGKSAHNSSVLSADSLASTEEASGVDTSGEMNSMVKEIGTPNNLESDVGSSVSSALPQSQAEVDNDIISQGHEHENKPDDKCVSSASESRPEVLSSTLQNTFSETSNEGIVDKANPLPEPEIETNPCIAGLNDDFDHSETKSKSDKGLHDQATASQSASDVSLPHLDVDSVQPGEPKMFDARLKTEPRASEQTSETRIMDSSVKSKNVAPDSTQLHSELGKLADVVSGEPEGTEGKTDNVSPAEPEHVDTMIDEKKTLGTLSGVTDGDKLLTQIVKANDDSLFLDFEPKEKPKDIGDETQETLHSQPDRVENMVDSERSIGGHGNGVHQMVKRSVTVSESDGEKPLPRLVEHNDDSASGDVGGLPDAREEGVLSDEGSSSDYNESEGECDNELVFAIAEYFKNSSHEEDTSSNDTSIATKSEGIEVGEEEELMGDLGPEEEFCFLRGLSMVSTDSNLTGDLGPEELGFSRRTSVVSTDSVPANATSLERESLDHVKESSAEEKSASNEEVPVECTARSDTEIPVSAHISSDASAQVLDDKSSCSKENKPSEKPGLGDKSKFAKIGADAEQEILAKEKVSSQSKPQQDSTESEIVKEKASSNSKPTCIDKTKEADTEQVSLMNENISSRSKPKSKQADTKSDNLEDEKTSLQSNSETHRTDATAERLVKENNSSQSKLQASDKDSGSKSKKPERENALSCLEKMIRKEEADCKSDGTGPKTHEGASDRDISRQSDGDYNFEVKTLDELRVEEPVYARSPRISWQGRGPDLPRRGRGSVRGSHRRYRSRSPPTGYFNDDMDIRQSVSEQRGDHDLRESYRRSNGDNYQCSRRWHRDDQHHEYRRSHRDADDSDNARDFPRLTPERLGNALRLVTAFVNDRPPVLSTLDEYRSQRQSGGERFNIFHPRGRPGGTRLPPPSDRNWLPERRFDCKNRQEDQRKQPLLDHECVPGAGGQCHLQDDRLFHPRESVPRDPFEHIDRARQRLSFRNQYEQEEMPRQLPRNEGYRRPPLDTLDSHDCVDQRPGPNQGLPCSGISQERTPRVDLPLVEKPRPLDEERPQPLLDLPFSEHERSPVSMPNNFQSQPEKRFRDKSMEKSPTKGFIGREKNFSTDSVTLMDREQKENMESNDKEGNRQFVSSPSILEPWYTSRKVTLPDLSQNKMPDLATNETVSKEPPSASQKFVESKLPDSVTATSEKRKHCSITLKPDENKKLDSVTPDRTESGQHREITQARVDRGDTLPGKQPDTVSGKDCDSEKKDSKRFNQDSNGHTNACVGGNVSGSIDKPTNIEITSEKLDGVEHKSKTSLVKTKSKPLLDSREEMQNWLNMGLKDDHHRKKSASKGLIQSSKQEKTLKEGQQTHASNVVAYLSEGQSKPVTEAERCKDKDELDSVAKKLLATKPIGTFCSVTEKDLLKGAVTPPQSNMSDGVQNVKAYLSDYIKNPGKSKPKSSASLQGLSFRKKPPEESQQKSLDVQENPGREERGVKHRHKHRHGTDEKKKERKSGGGEKIRLKGKVLEGDKHRKQETRAKDIRKESSVGGVKGRKGKCKESDALKGQIKRHSSVAPDKSQSHRGESHGKKKIKKISLEWYKKKKKMAASALSESEEGGGKSKEKTLDAGAFSLENEAKLREQIVASQARISELVNKRRQVEIIPHISLGKRNDQGRQQSTAVDDSDSVKQKTLKGEQVSHFADLSICNRGDKIPKSVVTKIVCSGKKKTSRSEVKCLSSSNRKVTSPDPENVLKQKVDKRGMKPGRSETQETEDVKKRGTSRRSSADKSEGSSSSLNQESNVAKSVVASVGIIDLTGSDSESVQETKERADRGCLEGSAVRTNAGQASRQGKEGVTFESPRAKTGALVSSQAVQESKQETTSKSSSMDKEVTCSSSGQELKKAWKEESSRSSGVDRGDLASSGQNQQSKKTKQGKTSSSSSVEGDDLTSSTPIRETKKAKMGETSRSLSADKVDTIGSKSESKKLKKERSDRSPEAYKRMKKRKKPHSYLSSCSDVSSSSLEHTTSLSRSRSRERRLRNRYRSPFSPGRFVGRRWSPNRRSRSRSHGRRPHGRSRSSSPSSRRRITRGRRSLTPVHQMHRSRSPPLRRLSSYRRLPLSPYCRSPSPQRLPYRRSLDRSPINSHDWLFGQRSPSPRYRKLHSRSPSPYRRKRRRSFSPQRRPRSRMSRNRSRSVSPRSWSEARSDSPTSIGSQSPRSDVDGSPMHIDLSSYRRAEMALSPDKPWRPPGTHPRDRNPGNVEPAPPKRYDFPENLHGEPLQGGWSRPPPGYNPRVPLPPAPFHPAAPTYYITGAGFQHPYGGQPIVSRPSHSASPMDPMQPHCHHQRNEMDNMQTGPDSNLPHFSQLLGAPLYNEEPPSHRQLDFGIPPPESKITGPEDGKGKPELITQHSNRPNISKNRDPRLSGSLQNVATVQTTAECVQKQSEEHTSSVKVIKENLNQPMTLVNPNKPGISEKTIKPGISDESNRPGISDNTNKPGPLEKSNRPGTSEKLIEKVTPEKKNSPVKAKSDHIPGIMSPNDNHLEINPRTSFLEGGAGQEAVDRVLITIDTESSWDKLPLHDCTDEAGRPTETYGYSDEQYRSAFCKIEFGWPVQSTLRRKYLEKHIWDNPNAYKDNQEQESDMLSEERKPGKRQKKTARKSFVTASLGHSLEEPNNESFKEARNDELKKLKTMRTEVLGSLLNEKNMEEKVKLKGLLEKVKKDIEKLEEKGKRSGMGKHVTTVGKASANKSAVALAQRLATGMGSSEMERTESTSSTSIASTSQATSAVGLGHAVTARASLLDSTPGTSDHSETSRTYPTAGHVTSAVRSASTLLFGNTPRTSENPPISRSTSSSISSGKAILLDTSTEAINNLNIGAASNAKPETKPELGRLGSQSNLSSGASNKTTAFGPDKPEAKKLANSASSGLKPATSQKPDISGTETKPMITKSFFSGLGLG